MIRYTRPLLAACAVLALAACQQQSAPTPAKPAEPAPSSQPATPPPPTTPPAAAAPATTATGDSIGIPECDNYLAKYEACVAGKVPEAARDALRQSLEQTRAAWRSAAANEATKAGLANACTQAHDAAKASLNAYGCTDF